MFLATAFCVVREHDSPTHIQRKVLNLIPSPVSFSFFPSFFFLFFFFFFFFVCCVCSFVAGSRYFGFELQLNANVNVNANVMEFTRHNATVNSLKHIKGMHNIFHMCRCVCR